MLLLAFAWMFPCCCQCWTCLDFSAASVAAAAANTPTAWARYPAAALGAAASAVPNAASLVHAAAEPPCPAARLFQCCRYLLVYPHGCDVANHLSLFLCVADYDKLLPGWSHFAQVRLLRACCCCLWVEWVLAGAEHAGVGQLPGFLLRWWAAAHQAALAIC